MYYLQSLEDYKRNGVFHQISLNPQLSPMHRKNSLNSETSTSENERYIDEMKASRIMQRHLNYLKQQMLELIDIETREKEIHGFMIIHEDKINTYKPVIYPNLIKFNEEAEKDIKSI